MKPSFLVGPLAIGSYGCERWLCLPTIGHEANACEAEKHLGTASADAPLGSPIRAVGDYDAVNHPIRIVEGLRIALGKLSGMRGLCQRQTDLEMP